MPKTRDRTSEVLIVSNDTYTIQLFFAGKTPGIEKDTLVVEASSLLTDERVHIEVLACRGENLYKFRSLEKPNRIRLALCLVERHDADIWSALVE